MGEMIAFTRRHGGRRKKGQHDDQNSEKSDQNDPPSF